MKTGNDQILMIVTTCPDDASARELAGVVLERRLAACVQVLPPMTSMFDWQGKVCQETEHMLVLKTAMAKWSETESLLRERHPYDVPEIIAFRTERVSEPYRQWLNDSVGVSL